MTRAAFRSLAAAGLAACLAWPAAPAEAQAAVVRDIATDANDPNNLADTEPSIAVNPTNVRDIVVVTFSEGWGPNQPAPIWRSADGGATWAKAFVLTQPPNGRGGPGDQKLSFDAAGNLFVAELGGNAVPRCFVLRQTGAPAAPLTVGQAYGDDQPHLEIDRAPAGNCRGRVYSPWLNFAAGLPRSTVSNSNNGGAAMADVAVGVNANFANRTTRIALARDGSAYVVYKLRQGAVALSLPGSAANDFENAQFVVHRSDDCGQTWNALGANPVSVHGAGAVQTLFTNNFGDLGRGKVARARSSDAWIATDPGDGDVYAAYVRRDGSGFAQLYVSRSTNRGATWSTRRVTEGTNHSAYPEVAVAANGAVGVLYVDFDNSGANTIFRHRFARSFDNGFNWTRETLQAMDPGPIGNAASGFLWGDYEGLTAQGNRFFGVFTGRSIGRTTLQLDPLFFSATAVPPPAPDDCLEACDEFRVDCMAGVGQPGNPTAAQCLTEFNRCRVRCQATPTGHGRLTVRVIVQPAGDPGRFNVQVDGTTRASNLGNGGVAGPLTLSVGVHTVSETASTGTSLANYTRVIGGDCAPNGGVTLGAGGSKTCTITNTRRVVPQPDPECLAACVEFREDCMSGVGQPGNPTAAQCLTEFNRCRVRCQTP